MHGCWGACMVAGGLYGCQGACVVARVACVARGMACMAKGGDMCDERGKGGVCVVKWACVAKGCVREIRRDTKIGSMSGRYASYRNAFLLTYIIGLSIVNVY